jgi:trimeric autotransporter adhesin
MQWWRRQHFKRFQFETILSLQIQRYFTEKVIESKEIMKFLKRIIQAECFFNCSRLLLLSVFFTSTLVSCANPLGSSPNAQSGFLSGATSAADLGLTDNTSALFGAGSSTGSAVIWDGTNSYVRLARSSDAGGVNASDLELGSDWTPAWSNIVGYWKLDEAAGNGSAADSSSVGINTGTVYGGVTQGVAGELSQAASFNGSTSGYIDLGTAFNFERTTAFSVSFWANTTSGNAILSNLTTGSALTGWEIDGNLTFFLISNWNGGTGPTLQVSPTSAVFNNGTWQHAVITYDGSSSASGVKIYINGSSQAVTVSRNSLNATIVSSMHLFMGARNDGSLAMGGSIDDVSIWNTALSASAVATIYQHESAKYAGTFTSRVMNYGSPDAWTSLSWLTTLPFGKELPDNAVSESSTGYSSMTSHLMSGIVGLWHFADASSSATVADTSGNGNTGTVMGNVTLGVSGELGRAALFDGSTGYITVPNSAALNPSPNFTLAAWVYPTTLSGDRRGIIVKRTGNSASGYILTEESGSICIESVTPTNSWANNFCGGTLLLNQWNHIVVAWQGNVSAGMYINGKNVATNPIVGVPDTSNSQNLNIGYEAGWGTYQFFQGSIEEVAIWSRALSAPEVLELYRRGANRIKFQTRVCTQNNCSDNPTWLGPDGTNQTYFSELNNNAVPSDGGDVNLGDSVLTSAPFMLFSNFASYWSVFNLAPHRQYIQYRAIMESDDTGTSCNGTWCSPELESVTVGP